MSYNAIVSKLENVRKLPDSDFLQIASCRGYQVIVGLEAKENDVVVLFPEDGALSEQYCSENNLYSHSEKNKDVTKKGYFDDRGRVRCQTFRKAKSEAYVADLKSLSFTGYDIIKLTEGTAFCELDGISICSKFVNPATLKAAKENKPKSESGLNKALMKRLFPEHLDTEQVKHARDEEFLGLVTLSGKIHGSSQRSSHIKVPEEKPINILQNLWNIFVDEMLFGPKHIFNFFLDDNQISKLKFYPKVEFNYKKIFGTRRVVKGEGTEADEQYRVNVHNIIKPYLEKNEIWYYEVAGFEDTGKPIMNTVGTSQLKPFLSKEEYKDFQKRFGENMTYKYGCLPKECDVYVYRIAVINEDGTMYDLHWGTVKDKCKKAGIKTVPQIEQHFITDISQVPELRKRIDYLANEGDPADSIDVSHVKEGIVARIENLETGKMALKKSKNYYFRVMEGLVKDAGLVDNEELEAECEF